MLIQLELFDDRSEVDVLQDQVNELRKSQDKVRKSLFARHGELAKHYLELNERFEILEKIICKGKYDFK